VKLARLNRNLHRWGAMVALLPIAVVIGSGLVLQLKKQVPWIQPPTRTGTPSQLSIGFDRILEAAKTVPEA